MLVKYRAGCRKPNLKMVLRKPFSGICIIASGGKLLLVENTKTIIRKCMEIGKERSGKNGTNSCSKKCRWNRRALHY